MGLSAAEGRDWVRLTLGVLALWLSVAFGAALVDLMVEQKWWQALAVVPWLVTFGLSALISLRRRWDPPRWVLRLRLAAALLILVPFLLLFVALLLVSVST